MFVVPRRCLSTSGSAIAVLQSDRQASRPSAMVCFNAHAPIGLDPRPPDAHAHQYIRRRGRDTISISEHTGALKPFPCPRDAGGASPCLPAPAPCLPRPPGPRRKLGAGPAPGGGAHRPGHQRVLRVPPHHHRFGRARKRLRSVTSAGPPGHILLKARGAHGPAARGGDRLTVRGHRAVRHRSQGESPPNWEP